MSLYLSVYHVSLPDLYEMLTGDPPYMGSTAQAVLGQIISAKPISATDKRPAIPANVDAALRKALEKLPADRFTSAQDFVRALGDEHFRYGEAVAGVADAGASPWNRLSLVTAGLAALSTVIAVALGWYVLRPQARPVAVFPLAPPEGQELYIGAGVNITISPDGLRVVYTGTTQLWQRRLGQLEFESIPGTEQARNPVISPDGASVAFNAGGSLKTVSLLGGPSFTVVVSGVPSGQGGGLDWGSDGMLYFTNTTGAIQRVPASGGEPQQVTTNDSGTNHRWVEALPDERGLLFTITRGTTQRSEIAVFSFEEGEVRTLFPGAMARYARSGHIVYAAADGSLLAAPIDLGRLLAGPSVGLPERVHVGGNSPARFALSETGTLLYVPAGGGRGVSPVWVNRDGAAEEITPGWRVSGNPSLVSLSLSPDGTRLVMSLMEFFQGTSHLWVKQLDTGTLSRLTFDGTLNYRPAWSPDGLSVTFLSNRGGGLDLWTRRADGSGTAELVLDMDQAMHEVLYSPDGTWRIVQGGARGGDIYAIRPGVDSVPIPLVTTEFAESSMTLSPDGRWLAYNSDESGRSEVHVRPFPDAASSHWQVSTGGGTEPLWAPSGRELFYRNGAGDMVAVQVSGDPSFSWGQQEDHTCCFPRPTTWSGSDTGITM